MGVEWKVLIGAWLFTGALVLVGFYRATYNVVEDIDLDDQPECCLDHEQERAYLDHLERTWVL